VLSRHKAEPGAKIASAFKGLAGTDRRHHGGRDQRPDPGNTPQPPAFDLGLTELFNLAGDRLDARVEAAPVFIEVTDQFGRSRRNLVLAVLQVVPRGVV
jgi:hypothetical protein